MKNILITVTGIVVFTQVSFAQLRPGEVGYDASVERLYASLGIRQINTFQTNPEFGNEEFLYTISVLNAEGKITEEKFPSLESYFSTDDEGFGDDSSFIMYEYLPSGMIAHITSLGFDLETEETYFSYDANGKLNEKTAGGAEARRYTFTYDDNGNIIKANGQTPIYTDGSNGYVDISRWKDIDYYTYKWNDKNQLVESQFFYNGSFYSKTNYTYENSRLSGFKIFTDQKSKTPDSVFTLTYNTDGTLNKMTVISNYSNSRVEYRCTYDKY